ncbi:unnamed protein product [Rotaria socialis]|uniref:Uncharacterized protein n=1 Tax=Rotaria socialis TaxID=392032 RepID=A0A820P4M4_9BILA|nr:unnamed protein product [Rotaria socialis]CAF3327490.1 unnamed protein product [Rotaria socialis]CAF3359378.1 unnamed protein product [Rotaria socialis]CAF4255778.1 unnamed protein product [Rotaria socialis]CAF4401151.1 unnamed protein product [Rotaria socialis]
MCTQRTNVAPYQLRPEPSLPWRNYNNRSLRSAPKQSIKPKCVSTKICTDEPVHQDVDITRELLQLDRKTCLSHVAALVNLFGAKVIMRTLSHYYKGRLPVATWDDVRQHLGHSYICSLEPNLVSEIRELSDVIKTHVVVPSGISDTQWQSLVYLNISSPAQMWYTVENSLLDCTNDMAARTLSPDKAECVKALITAIHEYAKDSVII